MNYQCGDPTLDAVDTLLGEDLVDTPVLDHPELTTLKLVDMKVTHQALSHAAAQPQISLARGLRHKVTQRGILAARKAAPRQLTITSKLDEYSYSL